MTRVSIADDIKLVEELVADASVENVANLEQLHVERLRRRLAKSIKAKELAAIVAAVNKATLSATVKSELIDAALESHATCGKPQVMTCYECYLTQDVMARFKSEQVPFKLKLFACQEHLLSLNARWLTEQSYLHCVCVLLTLAMGSNAALAMNPLAVKGVVDELKISLRSTVKRNPQFHGRVPTDYPPSLEAFKHQFRELYDTVFEHCPPVLAVDLGIQVANIYQLQSQCGCRKHNKKHLQTQTPATVALESPLQQPNQMQFMNSLVGLVTQLANGQGRSSGSGLPALMDVQSPRTSRSPLSLRSVKTVASRRVEEDAQRSDDDDDRGKIVPLAEEDDTAGIGSDDGHATAGCIDLDTDDEPSAIADDTSKPISWQAMVMSLGGAKPSAKALKRKSDSATASAAKRGIAEQHPDEAPTMDPDRKPVYWRGGAILTGKVRHEFVVFWQRGDKKDYRFKFDVSSTSSMQEAWSRAVMKLMERPSDK